VLTALAGGRSTTVAKAAARPPASWLVVPHNVLASRSWPAGMPAKPTVLQTVSAAERVTPLISVSSAMTGSGVAAGWRRR
jgi:hypothetical protein